MDTSDSEILIVASATARPGAEDELEAALREAAEPTRAQPGCLHFSLHRAVDAPRTIMGFERWASAADHARHIQGPHIQRLMARMGPVLAEPPNITAYRAIDA